MLRNYTFIAIGRKPSENSDIERVEFPELDISIEVNSLSPEQLELLKSSGLSAFLKNEFIQYEIQAKLRLLDQDDEEINPLTIEKLIAKFKIGPFDRLEICPVKFKSQIRSSCCERILPPIMKTTLVTELILFIPLLAAAIGGSEMQLFSADIKDARFWGTLQSLLFLSYQLTSNFANPGSGNMGEIGKIFDGFFHSCWRYCNDQKKSLQAKIELQADCCTRIKKWLAKGGMMLFTACFLFSDLLLNYQQFGAMESAVAGISPFSYFSDDVILYSMKINFILNQFNDPLYASSFLHYMLRKIEAYYTPKLTARLPAEAKQQEETKAALAETKATSQTPLLSAQEKPQGCWARMWGRWSCCKRGEDKVLRSVAMP